MAGNVNKVILVGNVGKDPEIRTTQDGKEIAHIVLATSETWKDKGTGEKREKTEWHRIVVFSDGLVSVIKNYIKKGSKLYIEGNLQTRKWTDATTNQEKYITEVVLQGFNAQLVMLDSKGSSSSDGFSNNNSSERSHDNSYGDSLAETLEDNIPF